MSITDELREFASNCAGGMGGDSLRHIADRIDAEHEKAMSRAGQLLADAEKDRDYNYANWQDCKQKVLQGNITFGELNAKIEHLEDELAHCMDADNVPVSIGDRMEWVRYKDDDPTIVRTVSGIGNGVFFAWSDEQGRYAQYEAHAYRHHHAPTVEDVLREFAYGLGVPVADSYVAAAVAALCAVGGDSPTVPHVIVADEETDCATGHCTCGNCGGAIEPTDAWCRHCGSRLEDA